MEETEVMKVHVVKTDPNYASAMKLTLATSAVGLLITEGLPWVTKKLAERVKARQEANASETPSDPTDPEV